MPRFAGSITYWIHPHDVCVCSWKKRKSKTVWIIHRPTGGIRIHGIDSPTMFMLRIILYPDSLDSFILLVVLALNSPSGEKCPSRARPLSINYSLLTYIAKSKLNYTRSPAPIWDASVYYRTRNFSSKLESVYQRSQNS